MGFAGVGLSTNELLGMVEILSFGMILGLVIQL